MTGRTLLIKAAPAFSLACSLFLFVPTSSAEDAAAPAAASNDKPGRADRPTAFAAHDNNYLIFDPKSDMVKYEISLKMRPLKSLPIYIAYSQKSLWDVGKDSLPFRETNYSPELFFETKDTYINDGRVHYRIRAGVVHESNGKDGNESRSWNRGYLESAIIIDDSATNEARHGLYLKLWPFVESSPQNSDILDYYGYGEVRLVIGMRSVTAEAVARKGKKSNGGSIEVNIKLDPSRIELDIMKNLDELSVYPYLHYWQGEGESLLAYDKETSRWGFGFLFAW